MVFYYNLIEVNIYINSINGMPDDGSSYRGLLSFRTGIRIVTISQILNILVHPVCGALCFLV